MLSRGGDERDAVVLLESALFGRFASFVSSSSVDPLAPRLFFLRYRLSSFALGCLYFHISFYLYFSQFQAHLGRERSASKYTSEPFELTHVIIVIVVNRVVTRTVNLPLCMIELTYRLSSYILVVLNSM